MHLVSSNNTYQENVSSWEPMKPLSYEAESAQYPIDAMPSPLKNAITSYKAYGQQPLPIIACSALANISLACQGLANVARDKYLVRHI